MRLVCIVEGHGEVEAVPNLFSRIRDHLEAWQWTVDPNPIKHPRSRLVDESVASPHRTANVDGIDRVIALARKRPADAVVVLCDSDDDCPAAWGPSAEYLIQNAIPGAAVMAKREYEAWILHNLTEQQLVAAGVADAELVRDAKGALERATGRYRPVLDQLRLTRTIDIDRVWARSDSFDKLMRSLARLFGVAPPARPPV